MNLKTCILTKNNCYKAGKTMEPIGIMLHSTAANNPRLSRYVAPDDGLLGTPSPNNWNQPKPEGRSVCVHGFTGKLADGTVASYQTLPWNFCGWHCGGAGNNTHIGIEICEDGLEDPVYFAAVYKEAAELCAYLCREFGLTEKNVICHSEGYRLGIASNHADVMHWFPKHGKNMDDFRAEVKRLLENNENEVEEVPEMIYNYVDKNMPEWAREAVQWQVDNGILVGDGNGLHLTDNDLRTICREYRMHKKHEKELREAVEEIVSRLKE